MKADFEFFVNLVVDNWRTRLFGLGGMVSVSRRIQGDIAEDYIVKKVSSLKPSYTVVKSKGSQSPADIFALAKRKDYWHIMLIQVKSSVDKDGIYKLNSKEEKVFDDLAKVINETIKKSKFCNNYADKSILISAGYAAVWRIEKSNGAQHILQDAKLFGIYSRKVSNSILNKAETTIEIAHSLKV